MEHLAPEALRLALTLDFEADDPIADAIRFNRCAPDDTDAELADWWYEASIAYSTYDHFAALITRKLDIP